MAIFGNNTAYVAARAKSRKSNLMDRTRLRQLIQQSPDQLTVAVADNGYRADIDLYAGHFTGGDLVEAALTHNLQSELSKILNLCNGKVRGIVEIYTNRFQYQNAKVVLRAVDNEVDVKKVSHSILPEESEINIPWLKIIEESTTLRGAVEQCEDFPLERRFWQLVKKKDYKSTKMHLIDTISSIHWDCCKAVPQTLEFCGIIYAWK